jgi:hypothetical protein
LPLSSAQERVSKNMLYFRWRRQLPEIPSAQQSHLWLDLPLYALPTVSEPRTYAPPPFLGSTFASVQPPSSTSTTSKPSLLSTLLASGAELGHSTSRLAPSYMPYIYGHRAGLHIIDLESSTVPLLKKAASLVKEVTKADGVVLIVGTRPEHRSIVRKAVERLEGNGFGVAGTSWQAGTLTNSVS